MKLEVRPWVRDLAPGWRWMFWAAGALLSACPILANWANRGAVDANAIAISVAVAVAVCMGFLGLAVLSRAGWLRAAIGVFLLVIAGLLLPRFPRRPSWHMYSRSNIKQLVLALRIYSDREGNFPDAPGAGCLARLYEAQDAPDLKLFRVRLANGKTDDQGAIRLPLRSGAVALSDYLANPVLAGKSLEDFQEHAAVPAIWERKPFWGEGKKRQVGFLGGYVRAMPEAEFQALRRGK